jgi:hypothetical protein
MEAPMAFNTGCAEKYLSLLILNNSFCPDTNAVLIWCCWRVKCVGTGLHGYIIGYKFWVIGDYICDLWFSLAPGVVQPGVFQSLCSVQGGDRMLLKQSTYSLSRKSGSPLISSHTFSIVYWSSSVLAKGLLMFWHTPQLKMTLNFNPLLFSKHSRWCNQTWSNKFDTVNNIILKLHWWYLDSNKEVI